jgi:hypothetical protein
MKYLVVALMCLGVASCMVKDERYYRAHPLKLQQALKACPNHSDPAFSCEQLKQLGERMKELAYQLQYSPQGFGHKILSLQETIAQQEKELKTATQKDDLKQKIEKNKNDLRDYLAVVKWLESPES